MNHWYLAIPWMNTVEKPLVCSEGDLGGATESSFREGRELSTWSAEARVRATECESGEQPDDVLQTCFNIPIFSPRLLEGLDREGISGGFQRLSIRVEDARGRRYDGFHAVNILKVVPGLDMRLSVVERFGPERPDRLGDIRDLRVPVLRQDAVIGVDLIRLREFPYLVFVSSRFRTVFQSLGCTGFGFKRVRTSSESQGRSLKGEPEG